MDVVYSTDEIRERENNWESELRRTPLLVRLTDHTISEYDKHIRLTDQIISGYDKHIRPI